MELRAIFMFCRVFKVRVFDAWRYKSKAIQVYYMYMFYQGYNLRDKKKIIFWITNTIKFLSFAFLIIKQQKWILYYMTFWIY